jgi:Flp pilus assembly protein TadG
MSARSFHLLARRLRRSQSGAAIIEFALLGPLFLMLLFGVLQVGIYLQNYNAVQSVASDAARDIMITYQQMDEDNSVTAPTDDTLHSTILGVATNPPYFLDTDRLNITVNRAGTSRVTGATEIDLQLVYTLNNFIPGVTLPLSQVTYNRSVWVVES